VELGGCWPTFGIFSKWPTFRPNSPSDEQLVAVSIVREHTPDCPTPFHCCNVAKFGVGGRVLFALPEKFGCVQNSLFPAGVVR
jgi:hypothetical protein